MKLNYQPKVNDEFLYGDAIDIGTVFMGTIGGVESVFYKVYDCVVDLDDGSNTWRVSHRFPKIKNYKELEAEVILRDKS